MVLGATSIKLIASSCSPCQHVFKTFICSVRVSFLDYYSQYNFVRTRRNYCAAHLYTRSNCYFVIPQTFLAKLVNKFSTLCFLVTRVLFGLISSIRLACFNFFTSYFICCSESFHTPFQVHFLAQQFFFRKKSFFDILLFSKSPFPNKE